jgi:TolB protein
MSQSNTIRLQARLLRMALAIALALPNSAVVVNPAVAQTPPYRTYRIAIPEFSAGDQHSTGTAVAITRTIVDDLVGTGAFTKVDRANPSDGSTSLDTMPDFDPWRRLEAAVLVVGRVERRPDGGLRVAYRLFDVTAGLMLAGIIYQATPEQREQLAHVIASEIYHRLIGRERTFQ